MDGGVRERGEALMNRCIRQLLRICKSVLTSLKARVGQPASQGASVRAPNSRQSAAAGKEMT